MAGTRLSLRQACLQRLRQRQQLLRLVLTAPRLGHLHWTLLLLLLQLLRLWRAQLPACCCLRQLVAPTYLPLRCLRTAAMTRRCQLLWLHLRLSLPQQDHANARATQGTPPGPPLPLQLVLLLRLLLLAVLVLVLPVLLWVTAPPMLAGRAARQLQAGQAAHQASLSPSLGKVSCLYASALALAAAVRAAAAAAAALEALPARAPAASC